MKTNRIISSIIGALVSCAFAQAQVIKLSPQPEAFITDVQTMMAATRNPQFVQTGKSLETLWADPKFNPTHKTQLIAVAQAMLPKGYKVNPYFYLLFEALQNGVTIQNLPADELSNFLIVTKKVVETADSKQLSRYLELCRSLFQSRLLYTSNYNKLYVHGGSLNFKFNEQAVELYPPSAANTKPTTEPEWEDDGWGVEPAPTKTDPLPTNSDPWGQQDIFVPPTMLAAGATIEFSNVHISIVTASDSATLLNTDGILSLKDGVWYGKKGKFTWENVGMPQTYATLEKYTVAIKNPKITAPEATLTYSDKLNTPVQGAFEYINKKRPKNVAPTYPRFMSLRNDVVLKNLGADVDYRGGFSLFADKMYSSSVNDRYATITIKHAGKVAFRMSSRRFALSDSLITSPQATFSGYFGGDSLYHPGVKLSYQRKAAFLRAGKVEKGGFKDTPYADGYHKMEIYADVMHWNLASKKMNFYIISGKGVVPAVFESFDYFDPERYVAFTGRFPFHPMQMLNNFLRQKNTSSAAIADLAGSINRPYQIVKDAMLTMVQQGMLDYDEQNEVVKLTRKGKHYLDAYARKKDFDTFQIPSFYGGSSKDSTGNATIDLNDNILTIRGIKQFQLSDSLRVYLSPRDNEIRMSKDRNFSMTGELKTGNFRFRSQQFTFSYKDFVVDMTKIDSITFIPQKVMAKGKNTEVGGDLRYSSGKIYINRPDNKSGRMKANDYPRLVIPEGVTVYFDQPTRDVAYNRKQVYFKIPSIDYDSLNVKDIDFAGTFHSGGIFPPFQTTLVTMPDNTLGFVHKPPMGSYRIYGMSSLKTNEIRMDKTGIRAEGELKHLAAVMQAEDILFTPDSLIASGSSGEIKEELSGTTYFPKVNFKDFALKWNPKADSMRITNRGGAFDFYTASTKLSGSLLLRNAGLYGDGTVKRSDSETASTRFKFNKDNFTADKAEFKIGPNLAFLRPILHGINVDVKFGVTSGIVNIQTAKQLSLSDTSGLTFPLTAYRTSISSAEWNTKAKTITMKGDVKTSTFTSLLPEQEGLSFNGAAANYDMEKMILNVSGVPYIKSADAKIIPEKGIVAVRKDAAIQEFKNAKVILDTLNEYHRLANGNIQILSRLRFEGDATYQYVTMLGDTAKIKMGNFELKEKTSSVASANSRREKTKTTYYTQANATIGETETFKISPKIRYKGDITMLAYEQNLQLDGFIQPQLKKRPDADFWIPYKATNTQNAPIQVNKNLKAEGNINLYAGLHFRTGTSGLYTSFLTPKEDPKDEDLLLAVGSLNDLGKEKKFEISTPDKTNPDLKEGNRYTFDDSKGVAIMEGKFDLFQPSEQVQTVGKVRVHLDSAKYEFNQLLAANFQLPSQVLSTMGEKIVKTNLDEHNLDKEAEENRDWLLAKLAYLFGNRASELYRDRSANEHVPLYQVFPKLNTTLVLSNLNMRWSENNSAFYSVGKIGLANIANTEINAMMDGFLEIRKTQAGDEFNFYLEASPEVWYYFGFRENQLGLVSSDLDFNNLVAAKAPKGTKNKEYIFSLIGDEEKNLFVERFTELYKPKPKVADKKTSTAKKEDPKKKPEKKKEETKEGF